jgi:PAP2 superfamily
MVIQGVEILPDRWVALLLVGSLIFGRARRFLMDWLPFLFLLVSYDYLRGFADDLNPRVNVFDQVHADSALFGVVPSAGLQALFLRATPQWYDVAATAVYFIHFALPLGFATILWLRKRREFGRFVAALTILSYGAWVTYAVYPAAPPWLASKLGAIDGVTRVLDRMLVYMPVRFDVPSIYHELDPNAVAAIPSLHAAYPMLVLLFAVRVFGRRGLLLLPYVLIAWLAAVYLGEHYVIDLLIGALYAFAAFAIAPRALSLVERAGMTLRSWLVASRSGPVPEAAGGGTDVFAP